MKLHPNVGCAGKDFHDYSFQMVYPTMANGRTGESPTAVLAMCKSCGDMFMSKIAQVGPEDRPDEMRFMPAAQDEPDRNWREPQGVRGATAPIGGLEGGTVTFTTTGGTTGGRWG